MSNWIKQPALLTAVVKLQELSARLARLETAQRLRRLEAIMKAMPKGQS